MSGEETVVYNTFAVNTSFFLLLLILAFRHLLGRYSRGVCYLQHSIARLHLEGLTLCCFSIGIWPG